MRRAPVPGSTRSTACSLLRTTSRESARTVLVISAAASKASPVQPRNAPGRAASLSERRRGTFIGITRHRQLLVPDVVRQRQTGEQVLRDLRSTAIDQTLHDRVELPHVLRDVPDRAFEYNGERLPAEIRIELRRWQRAVRRPPCGEGLRHPAHDRGGIVGGAYVRPAVCA